MNTLEAYSTYTPDGYVGECSRFVIDDITMPFVLHDVMIQGHQYGVSLWVKMESEDATGGLLVRGSTMNASSTWMKYSHTFVANNIDLNINFATEGVYYIYHPQLERGNVITDWSESPYDTEEKIKNAQDAANKANSDVQALYIKLEDSIQMVVEAINKGTLLEQTEDGWNFVGGGTTDQLKDLSNKLNALDTSSSESINQLKEMVEANDKISSYIKIDESGDEPIIKMGTYVVDAETGEGSFGKFSLQITPTAIEFLSDETPIAWISNQELHIERAVIEDELAVGGFVLKRHGTKNNVGFLWKGVTS